MLLGVAGVLLILVFFLFRVGVFVLDRNVFWFQIDPILKSGEIRNINQYRIVHNYVEMMFERDPDRYDKDPKVKRANEILVEYHDSNP